MESGVIPAQAPGITDLGDVYRVYGIRRDGERLLYFGEPLVPTDHVIPELWSMFREAGYEIHLANQEGNRPEVGHVIIAEPVDVGSDGIPWLNLVLFGATLISTLYVGAWWYHVAPGTDPLALLYGWQFAFAVLAVLGIHELGHYAMSRYHGVRASLPYFLPVPTIFGTMGAVIKISGRIPSRRALFDIGVAGPIAGIIAAVIVTVIGLHLPPVTAPPSVVESDTAIHLSIGYPPLLEFLAWLFDQPLRFDDPATAPNPVVIAGWLGMFITFLNLIPVGQLDGGHITRAMLGPTQRRIGALVPFVLVFMSVALYFGYGVSFHAILVWIIWAVFGLVLALVGPATPVIDTGLDRRRQIIGLVTFAIGLACFVPVPIEIVN